ncbi:MAG: hypothetical protein ABR555_04995 [Pyrinomonadaceae bacterium]
MSYYKRLSLFPTLIAIALLTACHSGSQQRSSSAVETPVTSVAPFKTIEPQHYRALRTTTLNVNGSQTTDRVRLTKSGILRRDEYDNGSIVYLSLTDGMYVLLPSEKVYAKLNYEEKTRPGELASEFESAARLLSEKPTVTTYQQVGEEVLNGRRTYRYRVAVNNRELESVNKGETLIWVDAELGICVKSENTTATGDRSTTELSEISDVVDDGLFHIPEDYKTIPLADLRNKMAGR